MSPPGATFGLGVAGKNTLEGLIFFSAMSCLARATAGLTPSVGATVAVVGGAVSPEVWSTDGSEGFGAAGWASTAGTTLALAPDIAGVGARAPEANSPMEERTITKVTKVTARSITRRSAISAGHTAGAT